MRYVMSDIHGEYELFVRLLEKIGFSDADELYICGDIIEKGRDSVRLARLIFSMPNVYVIMGNHEDAFIKHYNFLMKTCDGDFASVLENLKQCITDGGGDGHLLDWDVVDAIDGLPFYIETEDFICVHAGFTLTDDGRVPPLDTVSEEELIHNRIFKNPNVIPKNSKCVFFGHTATSAVCGSDNILAYKRRGTSFGDLRDFAKVHLDTCTFVSGILGCFCVDTCKVHYVKRQGLKHSNIP